MTRLLRVFAPLSLLCAWSNVSQATAPWLDSAWSRRLEITANPALIEGTGSFTDFTLLLLLTGAQHGAVFSNAKSDGSDLLITAGDGNTVLPHEIVTYNPGAQTAEIWFKAPALSDFSNRFYLYFGNPNANNATAPGAAWTNQHLAVYHFTEDPSLGNLEDFGPHDNDGFTWGPPDWQSSYVTAGQIGQGWLCNGETSFIDGDAIQSNTGSYTIGGWFACSNLDHDANFGFSTSEFHLSVKRHGGQKYPDLATANGFIRWNPLLVDNDLHQFVWTLNAAADSARFWFDGVEQAANAYYVPTAPYKVYTGIPVVGEVGIAGPLYPGNPLDLMEGTVDEFHFYEGVRSPAWIQTEYRNQKDPVNFYTYLEQTYGALGAAPAGPSALRLSAFPNPLRDTTAILLAAGEAGVHDVAVYDLAGRRVRLLRSGAVPAGQLRLFWDGRDDGGRNVSDGIYFVRAFGPQGAAGTKLVLAR